jgi:hypothetical protein
MTEMPTHLGALTTSELERIRGELAADLARLPSTDPRREIIQRSIQRVDDQATERERLQVNLRVRQMRLGGSGAHIPRYRAGD